MRPADTRLLSIGATFAVHYYTALVQAPETLVALYTPTAHVLHCFRKASNAAEINTLLTTVTGAGVKEVKLEGVSTTRTTSGGVKVTIRGALIRAAAPTQAFTQEVELRELEGSVFCITGDKLSYTAGTTGAGQTAWTAVAENTPEMEAVAAAAAQSPITTAAAASAESAEQKAAAVSAPAKESSAPSRKSTPAPAAAAAAAAQPEPVKKPSSFAEALKMKKAGDGAAFANKAVRVVASDRVAEASAAAAAPAGEKAEKAGKGEKKLPSKKEEKPRAHHTDASASATATVYYDIILKELAPSVTEEEVRALVTPVAAVKSVNVVKSEKRPRNKEAAAADAAKTTITFAFVQLDRPADAPASHVKDVVAKLAKHNTELHVEEVREKKAAAARGPRAAVKKPADAAHTHRLPEHKGKAPADGTAPVAKPSQK